MKLNKKHTFIAGFAASLLMLGACSESIEIQEPQQPSTETDQMVPLTINFETEAQGMATRGALDGTETGNIGSGALVDVLIFAVYDQNGNRLDNYQVENYKSLTLNGKTFNAGPGQNVMKYKAGGVQIQLMVDHEKTYKIAAWAQSSKCGAYTTTDLKNVTVSYSGFNNDESRDAFCVSKEFQGSDENLTVTLRRPFAQINVGATGADYRHNNDADKINGGYYSHSKVKITGVANTIDVVNDKIGDATSDEIVFDYSPLAAYINTTVPSSSNYNKRLGNENASSPYYWEKEQFLKIELDNKTGFSGYKINYPTKDKAGNYLTETFKYLSMCYVLAPVSSDGKGTLRNFMVVFASDNKGTDPALSLSLTTIPVGRNQRTNILGGLYYMKDPYPVYPPGKDPKDPDDPNNPDDPDNPDTPKDPEIPKGPDDPTTLFTGVQINVIICTDFYGDNSHIMDKPADDWMENEDHEEHQ